MKSEPERERRRETGFRGERERGMERERGVVIDECL
jgi:hypothetical protein